MYNIKDQWSGPFDTDQCIFWKRRRIERWRCSKSRGHSGHQVDGEDEEARTATAKSKDTTTSISGLSYVVDLDIIRSQHLPEKTFRSLLVYPIDRKSNSSSSRSWKCQNKKTVCMCVCVHARACLSVKNNVLLLPTHFVFESDKHKI